MKRVMFLLAVFGLAGSLWAADPIIGTWKLNMGKSKISRKDIRQRTEVYREIDANQIELEITQRIWTWPRQGGMVKVPKDYPYAVIETFIAPGEWYATWL